MEGTERQWNQVEIQAQEAPTGLEEVATLFWKCFGEEARATTS